jgi:hypothetical protein
MAGIVFDFGYYWVGEGDAVEFEVARLSFDLIATKRRLIDTSKSRAWLEQKINGNIIASKSFFEFRCMYQLDNLGYSSMLKGVNLRNPYFCETTPTVETIAMQVVSKMVKLFRDVDFVSAVYESKSTRLVFTSIPDDVLTPREWKL